MKFRKLVKSVLLRAFAVIERDARPKVVFYHDIGRAYTLMGTDAEVFRKHVAELRGGDCICLDDGFRGAWEHRDLLPKGVKIFVAPRLVGLDGYLSWDEMRILQKDYAVDFQCHTWSHQTLAGPMIAESPVEDRTEAWYERELVASKKKLEEELGKAVDELCFPVGYFSDEVIVRCKAAGYKKVYASYPGNKVDNGYVQPRCLVQDLGVQDFKSVLNGGMNRLSERYRRHHYIAQ